MALSLAIVVRQLDEGQVIYPQQRVDCQLQVTNGGGATVNILSVDLARYGQEGRSAWSVSGIDTGPNAPGLAVAAGATNKLPFTCVPFAPGSYSVLATVYADDGSVTITSSDSFTVTAAAT